MAVKLFREFVKSSVPQETRAWLRYYSNRGYRQMIKRLRAREEQARLVEESKALLLAQTGCIISGGPFAGMRFIESSVGSAWAPKLLGSYEVELAPIVESVIRIGYPRIIQIGAGEGYYAVGFMYRMPRVHVVAFEAQTHTHCLLRRLATANGVFDRLEIRGLCSRRELRETLRRGDRPFILCDVEGAESELLDPTACPLLRELDLLVELHHWLQPGIEAVMRQRFESSHRITAIPTRARTLRDLPSTLRLSSARAMACLDETRPCPMIWLWMTAIRPASAE